MVQCMNTQLIDLCHCSLPKENEERVRKRNFPGASCIYEEDIYSKIEIPLDFKMSCFRNRNSINRCCRKKLLRLTYEELTEMHSFNYCGQSHL